MKRHLPSFVRVAVGAGICGCITLAGFGQAARSGAPQVEPSRVDIFAGYGYLHPIDSDTGLKPFLPLQPGVVANVTGYFSPHFGIQAEGSYFPKSDNYCVRTGQAGPVFRTQYGRIVPFVHALGGVVRTGGPALQACQYGWGVTTGIGFDYILPGFNNHLALRPIQADYSYSHVDHGPLITPQAVYGGLSEIQGYRLSAGLVLRLGSMGVPVATVLGCAAQPATIYAGDPVTVNGNALNVKGNDKYTYVWNAKGGKVSGTESTAAINTAGLAAGDYTVTGKMVREKNGKEVASCSTMFTVKPFDPPTLSCSASPSTLTPGSQATITSSGQSPQNRALTYSYQSSSGSVSGNGSTATLSTTGASPGPITVICTVVDDLGKTATATTTVTVSTPPAPPAPQARQLCSLSFERDKKRPNRVDNEAKGCLDDIALTLNRETGAKLLIVGKHAAGETDSNSAERALNVRQYLVDEKGIDRSRIELRVGGASGRTVDNTLIPADASYDPGPVSNFDATTTTRHGEAYGKSGVKPAGKRRPKKPVQ